MRRRQESRTTRAASTSIGPRGKASLLPLLRGTISGYHAEVPCLDRYHLSGDGPRLERGHEVSYVKGRCGRTSSAKWEHSVPRLSRCQALFDRMLINNLAVMLGRRTECCEKHFSGSQVSN